MSGQFEMPSPGELARARIGAGLLQAAEVMVALLKSTDEKVRLRAAEALLNRAGIAGSSAPCWTVAEVEVGSVPKPRDPLMEDALSNLFPGRNSP